MSTCQRNQWNANNEFLSSFSYDFKAVACVSLPFTTVSVFRKWSGFGVTLHLTLLDMHLEHVHCSVTFCSLKITQMLGPVWLCSLAGQRPAIFITAITSNPSLHNTHMALPPSHSVNRSCVSHFISFEAGHVPSFLTCRWSGQSLSATAKC